MIDPFPTTLTSKMTKNAQDKYFFLRRWYLYVMHRHNSEIQNGLFSQTKDVIELKSC